MIDRDRPRWVLDLWAHWCGRVGHRFVTTSSRGRTCRRCLTWEPIYKQQFGRIHISGPGESTRDT